MPIDLLFYSACQRHCARRLAAFKAVCGRLGSAALSHVP
jgi:hypothetical protein